MPKKAAKPRVRVSQKINVDFYKVNDSAGGPAAFRDALKEMIARKGALRRTLVRGEYIDVHYIEQHGTIIEGEVGRLRKYDLPAIAGKDCTTRDLDLGDEESVTERTAFLFDSRNGILAVHAKREAVSASKIADLCDEIQKNIGQFFELDIVLTPDAHSKFERMNSYKSFRVKYAAAAEARIKRPDKTTKKLLDSLVDTAGHYITIEVGTGTKRGDKLDFGNVRRLLSKAETARSEGVAELKVSGIGAADEMLVVNLIKDRMRSVRSIEVVGGSTSYEQRRVAVRECYQGQEGNF